MDAAEWGMEQEPLEQVTLKDMDAIVKAYFEARLKYDEAKANASELYKQLESIETTMLNALNTNGKSNYSVDGIGTISVVSTESYKVPKDVDSKKKLFNYIKEKHGGEILMQMASIHLATLNSWANQEAESGVMQIPGLDQPTVTESIRFRKK